MTTEADKKPEDQVQPPAETAAATDQGAEQQPAQSEEEKIWAEMMAVDEPKPVGKQVNGEDVSHDFDAAVTESKADVAKDASEGTDKQPAATVKDAAPAASTPKEDIWANASPELRAAHEAEVAAAKKTANDARAQAGRIRKQAEELQRLSAAREADKPNSKKVSDMLDESLAEFPEIRDPVKTAFAPIEKQLEGLAQRAASDTAARQAEVNDHVRSQREVLDAAHPGWMNEYVTGARAKQFYDWVLDQPRKVRETVFVTNKDDIFDAHAGIEVFDAFKASLAPPEPNPTPANDGGQTQELSALRTAQLEGTRSPRSPGGAPRVTGIPRDGDEQVIWNAFPDDNSDDRLRGSRRA